MSNTTVQVNFPHTGIWYDYYNAGAPVEVSSLPFSLPLTRGEYRLFTDVEIGAGPVTALPESLLTQASYAYPNPTTGKLTLHGDGVREVKIFDTRGCEHVIIRDGNTLDISALPGGLYILIRSDVRGQRNAFKIIKK
jgi:hypothetical protein